MPNDTFTEGVKPGGLTSSTELRILLCYLLDNINAPVSRLQIEEALLGEELVNYFVFAGGLAALQEQGLIAGNDDGYTITPAGHTVAQNLSQDVPRSVRETAVRSVIRAQRFAAKQAAHESTIVKTEAGRNVRCSIGDESGPLFHMELYMPDDLSAEAVRHKFIEDGDTVYKLMLAALTNDRDRAHEAVEALGSGA